MIHSVVLAAYLLVSDSRVDNTVHNLMALTPHEAMPHHSAPIRHPQRIIRHTFTPHGSLGLNHPVPPAMVPQIVQQEEARIHQK